VARPPPVEITARGNERKSIFRDDRDRRHFLAVMVERAVRERVEKSPWESLQEQVLLGRAELDWRKHVRGDVKGAARSPATAATATATGGGDRGG
jgi:hypothetical protein